jgi:hypothetical protein
MQVFQTAGVPPRRGSIILATIGWTKKRRVALVNKVMAKRNGKRQSPAASLAVVAKNPKLLS